MEDDLQGVPATENDEQLDLESAKEAEEARANLSLPLPTPEQLQALRRLELGDIQTIDNQIVIAGMNLFFSNHFREAEQLFHGSVQQDYLVASAYGTLATIKGLLSMEQLDIDDACQRLTYAAECARLVANNPGMAARTAAAASLLMSKATSLFGRWGGGNNKSTDTPSTAAETSAPVDTACAKFRAEAVQAEAEVLRATLLLCQDSFTAYLKAGLALRRSYNTYTRLQQALDDAAIVSKLDRNSVEGVRFGLGCIHVVTSVLPPKILALLKALGYLHDRALGFTLLHQCIQSQSLRSPLASLFVLAFHGLLPSFSAPMIPTSLDICHETLSDSAKVHPDSVLHLWLAGRSERLSRDISQSTAMLERCLENGKSMQKELPQLAHFATYDVAWNYTVARQWGAAIQKWDELEQATKWSKRMFAYVQGCSFEMQALSAWFYEHSASLSALDDQVAVADAWRVLAGAISRDVEPSKLQADLALAQASAAYQRALEHPVLKLGGRVISVDQFVERRTQTFLKRRTAATASLRNTSPLAAVELLMLFNFSPQLPESSLLDFLALSEVLICAAVCDVAEFASMRQKILTQPATAVVAKLALGGEQVWEPLRQFLSLDGLTSGHLGSVLLCYANMLRELAATSGAPRPAAESEPSTAAASSLLLTPVACFQRADVAYGILSGSSMEESLRQAGEVWVGPYALYEAAMSVYAQLSASGDVEGSKAQALKQLEAMQSKIGKKDYNFEMQMQLRLHMTRDFLTH